MKNKKDLFNKLTKDVGGILDIDISTDKVLGCGLDLFRNNLKKMQPNGYEKILKGIDQIEAYYVNSSNLNAYAIRDNSTGTEFIGLTSETSLILQSYFSLLLSTKEFFPNIGEASKEIYELKDIIPDIQNLKGNLIEKTYPIDDERKKFAFGLWHLAMDFLLFHELGHHVQGHLFLLEELYNTNSISECINSITELDKQYISTSQILETDADRFSIIVSSLSANQIHGFLNLDRFGYNADKFRIIACYFLFHIFDELNFDNSLGRNKTHPHPAIRTLNILYYMVTMTAKTQKTFQLEIMKYSSLVEIIELNLNILSKYPEFKRRTKEKSVVDAAKSLRINLDKLLHDKLTNLKSKRVNSFEENSNS